MRFIALTPVTAQGAEPAEYWLSADEIVSVQRIESALRGRKRTIIGLRNGHAAEVSETIDDIFAAIDLLDEPSEPSSTVTITMPEGQQASADAEIVKQLTGTRRKGAAA